MDTATLQKNCFRHLTSLSTSYNEGLLRKEDNAANIGLICQSMSFSRGEFASLVGKTPQALYRYFDSKKPYVKVRATTVRNAVFLLAEIWGLLKSLVGDEDQIKIWLRSPNSAFDNQIPVELILEDRGREVCDALYSLFEGNIGG